MTIVLRLYIHLSGHVSRWGNREVGWDPTTVGERGFLITETDCLFFDDQSDEILYLQIPSLRMNRPVR